jgi:hypothetical protein
MEARVVCVLFLLIFRKFNTLFPCHCGNMKAVCYMDRNSNG